MDMVRISHSLAIAALLASLTCSGCASWHYRKEDRRAEAGSWINPSETPVIFQSLQNTSMNNWNFGRTGIAF